MLTITITDTTGTSGTVTVEAHAVADAIAPWYPEAPAEVAEVIGRLQDAINHGEDESGWATYLGITVENTDTTESWERYGDATAAARLVSPPAAAPHAPSASASAARQTPARTTTSGGSGMTTSISDVRVGIASANSQAEGSLGALQQALDCIEQAQGTFTVVSEGSGQADVSEARAQLSHAAAQIAEAQQAVALSSAEGVAARL